MADKENKYCDIDDYERRYGEVADVEVLAEILADAEGLVLSTITAHGIDFRHANADYLRLVKQVIRSVAHRVVVAEGRDDIPLGASQFSQSADGFSEQFGFTSGGSAGFGNVYMTSAEKIMLGIGRQVVASISPIGFGGGSHAGRHR